MSSIFKRKNRKSSRNSQTAASPVPATDAKFLKGASDTVLNELPVVSRPPESKRAVSATSVAQSKIPSSNTPPSFLPNDTNSNGYRAASSPVMNNWSASTPVMNSPSQLGAQGPSQQLPRTRQVSGNGQLASPQMNSNRMYESNPASPVINRAPSTPNMSANPQYPWSESQIKNLSPFPRYGHAANYIAARDGEIFVMGGLKGNNVFGDLWVIETDTMSGYLLETEGCPSPRVGHAALTLGNAFIVFGGDTKIQEDDILDDNLYLLNTSTLKWTVANPTGVRPQGRYGHTISTIGSRLYVFGGQLDDLFFNDLVCFDLTSLRSADCKWEIITPSNSVIPPCRTNHSIITYQDKLYLFGGTDGKLWYSDTYVFDPVDSTWNILDCTGYIPAPCEGHSATIVDDIMYIFGGRNSKGEDLGVLSALRLSTKRWYTFQNMGPGPSARSGHSMSSFNGNKIIVMGGESPEDESAGQDSESKTNTVYVLDTTRIKYPPIKPQQAQPLQQQLQQGQELQQGEELSQQASQQQSQSFQQTTPGLNIRSTNVGTTIASSTVHMSPVSAQSVVTPTEPTTTIPTISTPVSNPVSSFAENSRKIFVGDESKQFSPDLTANQTYNEDIMSPVSTVADSVYTDDESTPAPFGTVPPGFKALQNKFNGNDTKFHTNDFEDKSISSGGYESAEDAYQSAVNIAASHKYLPESVNVERGIQSVGKHLNEIDEENDFDSSSRLTIEPIDRSTPVTTEEEKEENREGDTLNNSEFTGKIPASWPSDINLHSHIQDEKLTDTNASTLSTGSSTAKTSNDLLEQLKATNTWYETELSVAKQNGYIPKTESPVSIESIRRRSIRLAKDDGASLKERDILVEALKELKTELALVQANVREQAEKASIKIADAEASRDNAIEEAKSLAQEIENLNNSREIKVDDASIAADEFKIQLMELEKALRDQTEENLNLKLQSKQSEIEILRLKDIESVTDDNIGLLNNTNLALIAAQSKISTDESLISALRQENSDLKAQLKDYELKTENYEKDFSTINKELEHHKQLSTESSNAMTTGISKIVALWGANKVFNSHLTDSRGVSDGSDISQDLDQNNTDLSTLPEYQQMKQKVEDLSKLNEVHKKASELAENELKTKLLELTQVKKSLLSFENKFNLLEETSKSRSIDEDEKLKTHNEELNALSEKLNRAEAETTESNKKYEAQIEDITKRYEELETVYNETRQSIKVNDRALRVTRDELTKFRDLNSKLQAELYELKLSIDSDEDADDSSNQDSRSRNSHKRTGSGDDSVDVGNSTMGSIQSSRNHNLNNHHLELQLRDLRAEVIILQDERDKLKDETIELKKKVIAMGEDLKTSQERIEALLNDGAEKIN